MGVGLRVDKVLGHGGQLHPQHQSLVHHGRRRGELLLVEIETHAADDGRHRMHAPAADQFVQLLAQTAQPKGLLRHFGNRLHHAHDVAFRRVSIEPEDQVGTGQHEEVQRVRVDEVAHVEKLAHQLGRRRRVDAQGVLQRLHRRQVVRGRTDSADAGRDLGHLLGFHAHEYPFEAAKFVHDEIRPSDAPGVVQVERHARVAFDARHRVDCQRASHQLSPGRSIQSWMRKVALPPTILVAMA